MAVATLMLVSLTACAANTRNDIADPARPQHVSTGDLTFNRDLNRLNNNTGIQYTNPLNKNVTNFGTNRNQLGSLNNRTNGTMRANDVSNGFDFSTSEIMPMNYGFITIDPNSYSTGTPSTQYPHTNRVQQGNYWYYTFSPEKGQRTYTTPQVSKGTVPTPAPGAMVPKTGTTTPPAATPSTASISQIAMQVIELTNNERRKAGLAPLKADASLSRVAQTKTNDMETKHYFSHTSPTYGSPFDMMRDFGVTYSSAGENIAMGQTSAQQVVTAWMNSEGHRKNILSPNYTNIGVGYTQTGNYWSQMFIGK